MSGLLIAGAGGHGCVVAETAQAMGKWERIAFLDDRHEAFVEGVLSLPVLGRFDQAESFQDRYADIVVAIGNCQLRSQWIQRFFAQGFGLPILVHPTAWVSPSAELAEGCVVFAQAAVGTNSHVEGGCIINTGATVDHDCVLGECSHICPGAHVGGDVQIGKQSWIGIGASIVHCVRIGSCVMIGAGSVVISGVEDNVTVAGVPAKVIKSHE